MKSAKPSKTRARGAAPRGGKVVESKICPTCQRPFNNRKRWRSRGQWEQIVYCSERCRP